MSMLVYWGGLAAYSLINLGNAIFLWRGFEGLPAAFRWLALTITWSLLADITGFSLVVFGLASPNIASNIHSVLALPLMSLVFYYGIPAPTMKRGFLVLNVAFVLFCLVNMSLMQGVTNINSYTHTITNILVVGYCILFYFKLLADLPTKQIQLLPMFWVVSGLFLASSGRIVIYGITEYMVNHRQDPNIVLVIMRHMLTIVQNTLVAIGVWLQLRQRPG